MPQYTKGNREWHVIDAAKPTVKIDGRPYNNGVGPGCTSLAPVVNAPTDADPVCACCTEFPGLSAEDKARLNRICCPGP